MAATKRDRKATARADALAKGAGGGPAAEDPQSDPRRRRRTSRAPVGDRTAAERIVDENETADRATIDDLRTERATGALGADPEFGGIDGEEEGPPAKRRP